MSVRLILLLILGIAGAITAAMVMPFDRNHRHGTWCSRLWFSGIARVIGLNIHVQDPVPKTAGHLLVSNHLSWLDIVAIGATVPVNFLSKSEVRGWPLMGFLAAATGTQFVKRGTNTTREVTSRVSRKVNAGGAIVIFPEGTTSSNAQPQRFHPRMLAAAIDAGLPTLPVALYYPDESGQAVHPLVPWVDDEPLVPHLLRILRQPKTVVHVLFGTPLPPRQGRSRKDLANESLAIVNSLIASTIGSPGSNG